MVGMVGSLGGVQGGGVCVEGGREGVMLDVGGRMMMTGRPGTRRDGGDRRRRDRRNGGQQLNCGQLVVNCGRSSRETGRWPGCVYYIHISIHVYTSMFPDRQLHTYMYMYP